MFARPMPKTQLIGIMRRRLAGHSSGVYHLANAR